MSGEQASTPRVFLSHASEDKPLVRRLAKTLHGNGIDTWFDEWEIRTGDSIRRKIDEGLADCTHFAILLSPASMKKEWVNLELDGAFVKKVRDRAKLLPLVYELSPEDLPVLIAGMKVFSIDATLEGVDGLIQDILGKPRKPPLGPRPEVGTILGELFGVPDLPPNFVPRSQDLAAIKQALLGEEKGEIGITAISPKVGIQGMGGIGKTVLVNALVRDEDVRHSFPDGVYWVSLRQPPNVKARQEDLFALVTGDRTVFSDEKQGLTDLQSALRDRACLVVVDNVWDLSALENFMATNAHSRLVFTTRDGSIIKGVGASEYAVDQLSEDAALDLLAKTSGFARDALDAETAEIAKQCGYLPLALALAGSMIEGREDMWTMVLDALRQADHEAIEADFPNYPYPHVFAAIHASVATLGDDGERYLDFAVFRGSEPVPEAAFKALWKPLGLGDLKVRRLLDSLVVRNLARRDAANRTALHDLQWDYVRKYAKDVKQRHQRLLDGYKKQLDNGWASGPDDGYYFQLLPHHLAESGRREELVAFVLDPDVQDKRINDPYGVSASFDLALRTAVGGEPLAAAPLVFKLVLGWQAFRRSRLDAKRLFDLARLGKLVEFERELSLYGLDQRWLAAARLTAAWLAPDEVQAEADKLRSENRTGTDLDERVDAFFKKCEAAFTMIDEHVGEQDIDDIFMQYGMMDAEQRASVQFDPDYEPNRNLVITLAPKLVGFAEAHPEQGGEKFSEFLTLMASNEYREYRNESLWGILSAAVRHHDVSWVQDRLQQIIAEACSGGGRAFSGALDATLKAVSDRDGFPGAFDNAVIAARNESQKQSGMRGDSDTWSELLRTFCALAEVKAVLFGEDAAELIEDARACHTGYAGFRAPACLTLAESVEICGVDPTWKDQALHEAYNAAQNILNPDFCLRTLSRVSALDREWWSHGPMSAADIDRWVREFGEDAHAIKFTARDRFDERQQSLEPRQDEPFIGTIRQSRRLAALAYFYGISEPEFVKANPGLSRSTDISDGTTVRVPDPLFTPLLAAFFAAKVLSSKELSRENRIELILKLVPPASTNPTALDTVLARLLLALRPDEEALRTQFDTIVDEITQAVHDYAPPSPAERPALGV